MKIPADLDPILVSGAFLLPVAVIYICSYQEPEPYLPHFILSPRHNSHRTHLGCIGLLLYRPTRLRTVACSVAPAFIKVLFVGNL